MPSALTGRTGEDVEAVVSILLCRRNERAARRRPGQGDRGVDVYVPTDDGRFDVYQVKKHDRPLISSQWAKVKKSYDTLVRANAAGQIAVRNWYLTLPLDQSDSDATKFDRLTVDSPFERCEWRGLTWLDALCSEYPEVVDYYLGDGKARLEQSHRDLMSVLGGQRVASEGADTQATTEGLGALHRSLNRHDPLYRYDFAVGSPTDRDVHIPTNPPDSLVFTTQRSNDGVCVTWQVHARCDESLRERPIPVSVLFDAEANPVLREALRLFTEYGKPFSTAEGIGAVTMDLPGGLGGTYEGGLFQIGPTAEDAACTYNLRMRTVPTDASPSAAIPVGLIMNSPTVGSRGARLSGAHTGGVFELESFHEFASQNMRMSFTALDVTGKAVSSVIDGVEFLHALPGSALELAAEYGPFLPFGDAAAVVPSIQSDTWTGALGVLRALHVVQQHTAATLLVPDLEQVTRREAEEWETVARLLAGETVTDPRIGVLTTRQQTASDASSDGDYACVFVTGLEVRVGDQVIDLGHQSLYIAEASIRSDPERPAQRTVTPLLGASWTRTWIGSS